MGWKTIRTSPNRKFIFIPGAKLCGNREDIRKYLKQNLEDNNLISHLIDTTITIKNYESQIYVCSYKWDLKNKKIEKFQSTYGKWFDEELNMYNKKF